VAIVECGSVLGLRLGLGTGCVSFILGSCVWSPAGIE
jgi:hypothetical protein